MRTQPMCSRSPEVQRPIAGAVAGSVQTTLGACLPRAHVLLVGENYRAMLCTDSQGRYTARDLPAGWYRIHVQSRGFLPFERSDIKVAEGRETTVNVSLPVALPERGSRNAE
jgi:hypothetical protein